jgi:ectoine hydroxylase-related dioxygenase (phytanoyl-CoA dioxygenase family)
MLAVRPPGARHRWHVDIEHARWPGITVFVGLRGTVPGRSGLRFVDGSHRVPVLPQRAGVSSDESAVALAREHVPTACLSEPPVGDGELLAFDGLTWHSSENRSDGTRVALLVQYAPADARISIPLTWDDPIRWHASRPPCVLVAGSDLSGVNRLVSAPLGCLP